MGAFSRFLSPDVSRRLLSNEGEFIVDEVKRHWVTRVPGVLVVCGGMILLACMPLLREGWWIGLLLGLGLGVNGFWRIHASLMDRFVLTNMRVFRVHGVISQHLATVPIIRILDISVEQPPLGQVLNYGHFVFESAAQDQGLKRIEYVPDIEKRDLLIQTVIQRAGLRARMETLDDLDGV